MTHTNQNVEVIAGQWITEEKGEGKDKRTVRIFQERKRMVVAARNLGALFRRDWELCAMAVQIRNTNRHPNVPHVFSGNGI